MNMNFNLSTVNVEMLLCIIFFYVLSKIITKLLMPYKTCQLEKNKILVIDSHDYKLGRNRHTIKTCLVFVFIWDNIEISLSSKYTNISSHQKLASSFQTKNPFTSVMQNKLPYWSEWVTPQTPFHIKLGNNLV